LIEKRLFGGYQVGYLRFLFTVDFWVFLKGVALGHVLCNKVKVVARLLASEGGEKEVAQDLGEGAGKMVDAYGGLPESFLDFWLRTAAPKGVDYSDQDALKRLGRRKERLGIMLPWLNFSVIAGAAFGVTYPDRVEQIWKANFETADHKKWQQARTAGVDLPEQPDILPLSEMESIVLEQTREYARAYLPELVESLTRDRIASPKRQKRGGRS
jgi:hypothetical protein